MTTLKQHIESINAKSQAWIDEDPANRWAGMITTDMDYWAEQGIHTVEDYERDSLIAYIYEGHKDAFGVKGRHYDFDSMSMDDLRAEADYISNAVHEAMEAEKKQQEEDLASFKALVQSTIDMGAGDEETALRWLASSEEFYNPQCVESWVWNHGILFTDYGKKVADYLIKNVTYREAA